MQVTITADWRTYEPNDPLHSDKEITIAGISGSVWRDGDDTYGWEIIEADGDYPLAKGNKPTLAEAITAAEDAIRAALEEG